MEGGIWSCLGFAKMLLILGVRDSGSGVKREKEKRVVSETEWFSQGF